MDPNGTGAIQALDAARFLKKSRLSDVVLSKIWDLSDPNGKGYLDKVSKYKFNVKLLLNKFLIYEKIYIQNLRPVMPQELKWF